MKPWRPNGSQDWDGWNLGERVTSIDQLAVGDLVLQENEQFDSLNLVEITRLPEPPSQVCLGRFVEPQDPSQLRKGAGVEFAVWDFDIERGNYFRVFHEADPRFCPLRDDLGPLLAKPLKPSRYGDWLA